VTGVRRPPSAGGRVGWNRRIKGWWGWAALFVVVVGALAVGATKDDGPRTPAERAAAIADRVACPVCEGESVAESRNAASENIRAAIRRLVDEGDATDAQILSYLETNYGGEILLVPRATGFDALVWALPVAALVCALATLTATFLRWRREAAAEQDPTDEDRALVAAALRDDDLDDGP
jgi:cytochrome c-type biogenesis protein CcmH